MPDYSSAGRRFEQMTSILRIGLIRLRAECTKGRSERVVPYSAPTGVLYSQYLTIRRELTRESDAAQRRKRAIAANAALWNPATESATEMEIKSWSWPIDLSRYDRTFYVDQVRDHVLGQVRRCLCAEPARLNTSV